MILENLLIIVIPFLLLTIFLIFSVSQLPTQKEKLSNNFQKLAKEFQLNYIGADQKWWKYDPSVNGFLSDRYVKVNVRVASVNQNTERYTCISMTCANLSYTMSLSKKDARNRGNVLLVNQGIQDDDDYFNKKISIQGSNKLAVQKLLNTIIKRLLIKHISNLNWELTVNKNEIYYEEEYIMDQDKNYKRTVELIKMVEKIALRAEEVQRIYQ